MANFAQLKQQLRVLKLSGMTETIEIRLDQAEEKQLGYTELLSLLIDDELELRRNRKLSRLILQARLPGNQTIETFDFKHNTSIDAIKIRELATLRFIDKAENIFFIGATGVGKTHLARAIAHMACRKYLSVQFFNFNNLLGDILKYDLSGKRDSLLKLLIRCDLLIIDDFGFKKVSPQAAEYIYTIVDQRYQEKSTLITSNRSMSDWSSIFPDPIMANAIMDRLAHNAHHIIIKGDSYRRLNSVKIKNGK